MADKRSSVLLITAAERLGVTLRTIYNYQESGQLEFVRAYGSLRVYTDGPLWDEAVKKAQRKVSA